MEFLITQAKRCVIPERFKKGRGFAESGAREPRLQADSIAQRSVAQGAAYGAQRNIKCIFKNILSYYY